MTLHASPFILLSTTKVGDNSLVLHTLGPEWGRRSFITSAGKGMAMFQPLSLLEGEVAENPRTELWRVRNLTLGAPLGGIRSNVYKNSMTLFMSEVLLRTLREGSMEEGLYEWCRGSILTLDALPGSAANWYLCWLLELCGALGFSPSAEDLAPFAGESYADVRSLLAASPAEALLIPMSGQRRSAVAQLLLDYIGYHTDSPLNVRSLKVLGELFR